MLFRDREDAGRQLARKLEFLRGQPGVLVLGIPRGGVIVAAQVADALPAPLEVLIAHKIGAPTNTEFAIGAIASTGRVVLDRESIGWLGLSEQDVARQIQLQRAEIARRLQLYSPAQGQLDARDRIAVLIDDGVATGLTTLVALQAVREMGPSQLILAVPVGPPDVIERLGEICDRVVTLDTPEPFMAVGRFYTHFGQTTDEEVVRLLREGRERVERERANSVS